MSNPENNNQKPNGAQQNPPQQGYGQNPYGQQYPPQGYGQQYPPHPHAGHGQINNNGHQPQMNGRQPQMPGSAGERGAQSASSESSDPDQKKLKILVVEDNESNYELFDELLSERYDIVRAADGEEAIKMYAQETPDLIVMDINLPYKDGYEATSEIRLLSKTVPIIAVTAYAQQTDRERVMNSGFDSYLSKPVDEESLLAEIRKLL